MKYGLILAMATELVISQAAYSDSATALKTVAKDLQLCNPKNSGDGQPLLVLLSYQLAAPSPSSHSEAELNKRIEEAVFRDTKKKEWADLKPCAAIAKDPDSFPAQTRYITGKLRPAEGGLVFVNVTRKFLREDLESYSKFYFSLASGKQWRNADFFTTQGIKEIDKAVARALHDQLGETAASCADWNRFTVANTGALEFTPKGLHIVYSPEDVVCIYSNMTPFADFDWATLKPFMSRNSPITR